MKNNLENKNWLESKIKRLEALLLKAKNHDKKAIKARIFTFQQCLDDLKVVNFKLNNIKKITKTFTEYKIKLDNGFNLYVQDLSQIKELLKC